MKYKILTLTSISHFINDGNSWFLPVSFTFLIEYLDISKFLIGVLSGIFFGVSAVTSPLVTRLVDRSNTHARIMGLGILLWGFGLILFGSSISINSLPLMILSVAIAGFSSAFYHPLGAAILSITYKGNAGTALGINGSMGSLGRAIYPTLMLAIFGFFYRNMFLTSLILGIISILASLPSFFANIQLDIKKDESPNMKSNTSNSSFSIVAIILLTISALLRSVFTQGISQFLPTLLVGSFNYSYSVNLGEALSISLSAAVVGQPILGLLSDRVGRRSIYGISSIGAVISLLLFLRIPDIVFLCIFGFFTFSAFPLMLSLVGDFVPRNSTSFANSIVWGLGVTGGGVIGPILMGSLSQVSNLIFASEILSIVGVISALVVPFIPKPPKKSKVPLFG
ncbi:MFS transporter [Sulfolobus acidocaldarius SUSAZ]|nr:MFS transporter [Sulfolobus acidocaldarius SUSAZ]